MGRAVGKRKTTTWKVEEGKGNLRVGERCWTWRWFGGVWGKEAWGFEEGLEEREVGRGAVGERL